MNATTCPARREPTPRNQRGYTCVKPEGHTHSHQDPWGLFWDTRRTETLPLERYRDMLRDFNTSAR